MNDEKKNPSETLASYLGDDEIPTRMIQPTKQFAYRKFGRSVAKHVINALERLERKKAEAKK